MTETKNNHGWTAERRAAHSKMMKRRLRKRKVLLRIGRFELSILEKQTE